MRRLRRKNHGLWRKDAGGPHHRRPRPQYPCISTDTDYHLDILRRGSYLGFDRFGMESGMPDPVRVASMLRLLEAGCAAGLVVSHDSVWYWVGGPKLGAGSQPNWVPTNLFERIIPMLKGGGAADAQISTMLCDNPRRLFADEPLSGFVGGG